MIHYHGGPITPETCALRVWRGRHAFVSFAHPGQIRLAAEVTQSFALDNGAFSFWKSGKQINWPRYYEWVGEWLSHPGFDFAVIPDVIGGSEEENDALLAEWPYPIWMGAPVWHTNESLERFARLARDWPRVCIGSSGEYDVKRKKPFLVRAYDAFGAIADVDGRPACKVHGLRMLNPEIFSRLPLSSADSTNVALTIGMDHAWTGSYAPRSKETRAQLLVERIEALNSTGTLEGWKEALELV